MTDTPGRTSSLAGDRARPSTVDEASAGDDLPAVIASRYRVLGVLGRGAMGQVLRVEHVHTGEKLALKALFARRDLRGELAERFKREARAWTLIKSEHVVRTLDAGMAPELGGAPYLVMELLSGVDLEDHVARSGKLAPEAVVALVGQVARGLARAHALGMVHRDLKPANLFLHDGDGRVTVKILDFGLLKIAGEHEIGVTAPGVLLGTPLYMAPEQVRGANENVSPAADIWALGMVVFQLLTGARYWKSEALPDILCDIVASQMTKPSARAPELGEAFDAWFLRSCERDPAARWPTVTAQWEALSDALLPAGAAARLDLAALIHPGDLVRTAPRTPTSPGAGPGDSTFTLAQAPSTDGEGARAKPASGSSSNEGERRQVTVMFFSPSVRGASGEVDPEEVGEILRAFDDACTEVLGDPDGSQSHPEGAGRYVYFGYPRAHGNDAVRAVAAGLAILEATLRLGAGGAAASTGAGVAGARVSVRIGIHSGVVLAADIEDPRRQGRAIVGAAPSIAAEIERMAPANGLIVSAATQRLVRGFFTCRSLGARDLSTASMEVFQVTDGGADPAHDALQAAPFVGRDAEIQLLLDRWERVGSEGGQVALLAGEAGIGKSRCIAALKGELAGQPVRWLACQCSPYFANRAFYPIIELVGGLIQSARGDAPEERAAKLRDFLRGLALPPDAPAMLASLLSLPADGAHAPLNLTPQRQRQLTEHVLLALLQLMGERDPLCLVIEDLHWADPSTLELLSLLVDQAAGMRVLALLTSRPDFHAPWGTRAHVTHVNLVRLPKKRAEAMIRALTRGRELPPDLLDQIVARTDGVPLFVEELTRMVLDAPGALSGAVLSQNIPSSLRESLTARLDRLGRAKGTAQLAAVVGLSFDHELLAFLSPLDAEALDVDLARLVEGDLILQRGVPPRATYAWKHSLVQEAAYESLLKNARRQAHARLAEALSARPDVEPELLAHHLAAAGLAIEAAGQLMRAAQGALQRSANVEAKNQLDRAISLIESVPDGPARTAIELAARALLGVPLFSTRGYGAPEVEQTYARAAELAERIHASDAPELFPVLWGLWIFHLVRARHRSALDFAARLVRLADHTPDPGLRLAALVARGNTECLHGPSAAAREDLEQAIALYDPAAHRHYAYVCGQDLAVQARSMLSWSLWMLGYPDQALARAREAVAIAEGLSHPASLGFALAMKMVLHQYRREPEATEETSGALIALSQAQGLVHWIGPGILSHGWAVVAMGRLDEGLEEMRRGREMFGQVGALVAMGFHDALLIEACGKAGAADECQRRLDLVRPVVEAEERIFEPELHRVEGELRRALGDAAGAEALFPRAHEAAARVGARSFELRTALSPRPARGGGGEGRGGDERRGAREGRAALRDVHRGARHGGSAGRAGAARRVIHAPARRRRDQGATAAQAALASMPRRAKRGRWSRGIDRHSTAA